MFKSYLPPPRGFAVMNIFLTLLISMAEAEAQQEPCWFSCENLVTKNLTVDSIGTTPATRIPYGRTNASNFEYLDADFPEDCGKDKWKFCNNKILQGGCR